MKKKGFKKKGSRKEKAGNVPAASGGVIARMMSKYDSVTKKVNALSLMIMVIMAVIIIVPFASLSIGSTTNAVETILLETAKAASNDVAHSVTAIQNMILEFGVNPTLGDPNVPMETKASMCSDKASGQGFLNICVTDKQGNASDGQNVAEMDFFKEAMNGNTFMSTPQYFGDDGNMYIIISSPLFLNGVYGSEILGAVYAVLDGHYYSDIVSIISVGKDSIAYMVDENGIDIADSDYDYVLAQDCTQEAAKTDSSLKGMAKAEQVAFAGGNGMTKMSYDGMRCYLVTVPVGETGWVLGIYTPIINFMKSIYIAVVVCVIIGLIALVLGSVLIRKNLYALLNPLSDVADAVDRVAEGDFGVEINYESNDEIGRISKSMRNMVESTDTIITDVVNNLEEMAQGNFNVSAQAQYKGEYVRIDRALNTITSSLSDTLSLIRQSANSVNSGAEQMSAGAQMLASGATEQAATVEELTASINSVSQQIHDNAAAADRANEFSKEVGNELELSKRKMDEMKAAMEHISKKSLEINGIIRTIDDIAFQTNILALNAAVEAARAGSAGKGFAVVADEVRNLAGKSAEAASSTTALINDTIKAVNAGTGIAEETAAAIDEVVKKTAEVVTAVTDIAEASQAQSMAIGEITVGLNQVSSVVQSNSATSEESAATSQQLSGQANILRSEIEKFRIR